MRNLYIRFLASIFIAGLLIMGACKSNKNNAVTESKMTEAKGKASFYANRLEGKKRQMGRFTRQQK